MLDVSPHYSRSILRSQRKPLLFFTARTSPILPCKHFLADNVSLFSYRTPKELQVFNYWRANLRKSVKLKHFPGRALDRVPNFSIGWKYVPHTRHGLYRFLSSQLSGIEIRFYGI